MEVGYNLIFVSTIGIQRGMMLHRENAHLTFCLTYPSQLKRSRNKALSPEVIHCS